MIAIDENRCNLCGICVPICPSAILSPGERSILISDSRLCILCGHCKAVCPADAVGFSKLSESEFESAPQGTTIPEPRAFLRFLRSRRSLRAYRSVPVDKEKLKQILEAGRFAPTGANRQALRFTVVRGRKALDRIAAIALRDLEEQGKEIGEVVKVHRKRNEPLPEGYSYKQFFPPFWNRLAAKWREGVDQFLHHAPALIIIHVKKKSTLFPELDAGISAAHMLLMAETLGLGTCFVGFLILAIENSTELKDIMNISSDHQAIIAFTVGYPAADFLRLVARNSVKVDWVGEID
jgi:nitroreductase/NAD-dependent dihydropyrimidine dehydrogenase PreA subunit